MVINQIGEPRLVMVIRNLTDGLGEGERVELALYVLRKVELILSED